MDLLRRTLSDPANRFDPSRNAATDSQLLYLCVFEGFKFPDYNRSTSICPPVLSVARIYHHRNGCLSCCLGAGRHPEEARGTCPLFTVRLCWCCLLFAHSWRFYPSRCVCFPETWLCLRFADAPIVLRLGYSLTLPPTTVG